MINAIDIESFVGVLIHIIRWQKKQTHKMNHSLLKLDADVCCLQEEMKHFHMESHLEVLQAQEGENKRSVPKQELMVVRAIHMFFQQYNGYSNVIDNIPNLFAKEYSQMHGTNSVIHKIKLKECANPSAQKLRILGTIQR